MKLIRFGKSGQERPGIQLNSGQCIDVTSFGEDYNEEFFRSDGIKGPIGAKVSHPFPLHQPQISPMSTLYQSCDTPVPSLNQPYSNFTSPISAL